MGILVGTDKGLFDLDEPTPVLDADVTALARDADGWWAITDGYRILSSPDAQDWTSQADLRGLRATCLLPSPTGVLVGTSEAHLVRVANGASERVRSFDRVPTRNQWYTPWGGPPDTRSLTRDAGGAAFANVHVGGIVRSDDDDRWKATSMDIDADVHQVLAHPTESGLVFAATAIGLATSRDRGETWEFSTEGLHAAYCRAVALAGKTLLLSASKSHTGRQAALYRRPVDGGVFERCTRGFPEWFGDNVDTHCLDAIGDRAVVGTSDGTVFATSDAGASWDQVADGLPRISAVLLT